MPNLSEEEQIIIGERKDVLFRQLAQEKLQPTKGLSKIIEYIRQNRSKLKIGKKIFIILAFNRNFSIKKNSLGLATNATRTVTEFELAILNIDEKTFFDAILIAEEFGVGKFSSIFL